MASDKTIESGEKYLTHNYGRLHIVPVRGRGAEVWDAEGRRYLDFVAGIAVNSVGHCHPAVVSAIKAQAEELIHCSNLYWIRAQVDLAATLARLSGLDQAFFCNSGAEANEAAIKMARRYAYLRGNTKPQIVTFQHAFHGRTLGTLAATGNEKFMEGFAPLPGGFVQVPFNDPHALQDAVSDRTVAVLVEPVQGEGGVQPTTTCFMQALSELRREKGLLLIFDEVQCGLGRTGQMFAFQHYDVQPDILTLAKALGGGLPIGALVAKSQVAEVFQPGTHGSTFGGNPVACAAANAVLQLLEDGLVANAADIGKYFMARLQSLVGDFPLIQGVRGLGLIIGMPLDRPGAKLVELCQQRGLLINCTEGNVIRFIPPLIISRADVDEAVGILTEALNEFQQL